MPAVLDIKQLLKLPIVIGTLIVSGVGVAGTAYYRHTNACARFNEKCLDAIRNQDAVGVLACTFAESALKEKGKTEARCRKVLSKGFIK